MAEPIAAARRQPRYALPPVELAVEDGDWPPEPELEAHVGRALAASAVLEPKLRDRGELSVLFTDDAAIAKLNGGWRGKDKATNVLSFPAPEAPWQGAGGPPPPLGDIVVAQETVTREAAEAGLTLAAHLTHLLVHGLLHLVGHDHVDDSEAEAMERLETQILASLGIADPYAGTEPEGPDPVGSGGR